MHERLGDVTSRLRACLARVPFSHAAYGRSRAAIQQLPCVLYRSFPPTFVTAQQLINSLHPAMLPTALWYGVSPLAHVPHAK